MGAIDNFTHVNKKMTRVEVEKHGRSLIEQAQWESGNGGYSGTWAECTGVKVSHKRFKTADEAEEALVQAADPLCEKWGPMVAVELEDGTWCFGAICSS